MEVNHDRLAFLMNKYRALKKPLFVEGATGIGKSEAVKKESELYAQRVGKICVAWNDMTRQDRLGLLNGDGTQLKQTHLFVDLRTALLEPTDLMGMPNFKDGYVQWQPTLLFKILSMKDVSATVFLDEFNLGSRMVQNAAYQLVLDKAVGETKLSDDVFVMAAGNRVEDKANIIETPAPLNNRFGHCTLQVPTVDEWVKYNMNSKFPDPRMCGFLKFKPEFIHGFKHNLKEKAFPTPRALQETCMLTHNMNEMKELDKMKWLAQSKCGEAFGIQWEAFLKLSRKVNVDDVLKKPELVKELKELDLKYSLISGVAYKVKQDFKNTIEPALEVMYQLEDEYGIFLLRMCKEMIGWGKLTGHLKKTPTWEKVSTKFQGLMSGW